MKRLGIDFGSSYIKCADAQKEVLIALDKKSGGESVNKIPNIITYNNDNTFKLGKSTYKMKSSEGSDISVTIDNIKACLSDYGWNKVVGENRTVNAVDVTKDIMQCLYDMIHNKNKNESEYYTTITTPVCFSERQREIIRYAAENAGFKVESMITEPFASLFYLMRDDLDEDHNVLVFDIGGGTLDICLVSIVHKSGSCIIKTESTAGMNFGGISINNKIIDMILLPKYKEMLSKLVNNNESKHESEWNRTKLFYEIDSLKEEMFTEDYDEDEIEEEHEILFSSWNSSCDMSLSVSEIYKMLDEINIRDNIMTLLDNVIDESTLICDEITDVFLTGGTSLIPYFKNVVVDYLKENGVDDVEPLFELYNELDVEEQAVGSVALGAGIYNVLSSENREEVIIQDRIPLKIFSKDPEGKAVTKLTADCVYKSYHSSECSLNKGQFESKKIDIFQKLPDENSDIVYIGYIPINDEVRNSCTLYRLGIDTDRKVFAEFGVVKGNKNDAVFEPRCEKQYLKFEF